MGEFEDETVDGVAEGASLEALSSPVAIPFVDVPAAVGADVRSPVDSASIEPVPWELASEPVPGDDLTAIVEALDDPGAEALAVDDGAEDIEADGTADQTQPEPPVADDETDTVVQDAPPTDDEIAAAVAATDEQVAGEDGLDDITPGTTRVDSVEEAQFEEATNAVYGAPWWPFLVYLGLWVAFAGVAVWQFEQLPQGVVVYEAPQYTYFVFGGLALAVVGVFLIVGVWLAARTSPARHRVGLFSSAFVKGAAMILIGVVVWWGTIMAIDYLRLGRLI